jgi:ATP-dependent DNA helicase RecG
MLSESELLSLLSEGESARVERKASLSDPDRVREVICAFANDLDDSRLPGVIFIGANDDGSMALWLGRSPETLSTTRRSPV